MTRFEAWIAAPARRALIVAAAALAVATPASAVDSVKILIAANPGGGWDQTGRALQAAMQSGKIAKRVTVDNRGGAGGTIALAQFVSSAKGDASALLVGE